MSASLVGSEMCIRDRALALTFAYDRHEVCVHCYACKGGGPFAFSDFREAALHRDSSRSHEAFMAQYLGDPPALTRIPGFHSGLIKYDWMHSYLLGTLPIA
eukprot:5857412-Alexandrium_andersonii.AAC.1